MTTSAAQLASTGFEIAFEVVPDRRRTRPSHSAFQDVIPFVELRGSKAGGQTRRVSVEFIEHILKEARFPEVRSLTFRRVAAVLSFIALPPLL